ncbi:MAG: hypothetical protein LYZ66_06815 [Nitrososphaerales archaeon]|nr:hypothetical protein [Nitrososphaerales archaeon]
MRVQLTSITGLPLALGTLAVILGGGSIIMNSLGWYYLQESLAFVDRMTILGLVAQFYAGQALAMVSLFVGVYLLYRVLLGVRSRRESPSGLLILSEALSSRSSLRIGSIAAVAYGLVYALVSSVIVYQPGVDFGVAYGASATSWTAVACCGAPGTVPSLVVYLAPQAHIALQLVPLSALFAVLVPILVGLNVTVAAHAVRGRPVRTGGKWLGSIGVLVGLFTGCPTCAGFFLAGAIGGLGATTLAITLAPYQLLFVSISLPLLLASPIVMAATIKRASCAIGEPRT